MPSAGEGQGLSTHLLPCCDKSRRVDLLLATCQRIVDDELFAGVSHEQDRVFELGGADRSFWRRPGHPSCRGCERAGSPQDDRRSEVLRSGALLPAATDRPSKVASRGMHEFGCPIELVMRNRISSVASTKPKVNSLRLPDSRLGRRADKGSGRSKNSLFSAQLSPCPSFDRGPKPSHWQGSRPGNGSRICLCARPVRGRSDPRWSPAR
jgi:hypothetical protein